jgi:hypothetical protein
MENPEFARVRGSRCHIKGLGVGGSLLETDRYARNGTRYLYFIINEREKNY